MDFNYTGKKPSQFLSKKKEQSPNNRDFSEHNLALGEVSVTLTSLLEGNVSNFLYFKYKTHKVIIIVRIRTYIITFCHRRKIMILVLAKITTIVHY